MLCFSGPAHDCLGEQRSSKHAHHGMFRHCVQYIWERAVILFMWTSGGMGSSVSSSVGEPPGSLGRSLLNVDIHAFTVFVQGPLIFYTNV